MSAVLQFLLGNADIIELVGEAIARGVSKADIKEAIKKTMVATSDRAIREELGK